MPKSFRRATAQANVEKVLKGRFKPIVDDTFDDLLAQLDKIDLPRKKT